MTDWRDRSIHPLLKDKNMVLEQAPHVAEELREKELLETERLRIEVEMRERLKIDPLALQDEFLELPSSIARVASLHASAIGEALRAEIREKKHAALAMAAALDALESEAESDHLRKVAVAKASKAEAPKYKAPTVDQVKARAALNAQWLAAQEDEAQAQVRRAVARGNLDAIMAKRDALIQLGATERAEMEWDPVVRDARTRRRAGQSGG